jgi:hypothetical protein
MCDACGGRSLSPWDLALFLGCQNGFYQFALLKKITNLFSFDDFSWVVVYLS